MGRVRDREMGRERDRGTERWREIERRRDRETEGLREMETGRSGDIVFAGKMILNMKGCLLWVAF